MSDFDSVQDWLAEEMQENINAIKVLPKRLFNVATRISEFDNFYNLFEDNPAAEDYELTRDELQLSILTQAGKTLLQDTVPKNALQQFNVNSQLVFKSLFFLHNKLGLSWYFQEDGEELFFSMTMTLKTFVFLEEKFSEIDANLSEDDDV